MVNLTTHELRWIVGKEVLKTTKHVKRKVFKHSWWISIFENISQNKLERIVKMQNLSQNELMQITKMQNLSQMNLSELRKQDVLKTTKICQKKNY